MFHDLEIVWNLGSIFLNGKGFMDGGVHMTRVLVLAISNHTG